MLMEPAENLRALTFIAGCNTPAEVTRAQLAVNVERDLPWLELEPVKDRPLVIVAGGPSLMFRWPEIWGHDGDVLALNNAYAFLMERGIEPDYFMLLDARQDNVNFLRTLSRKTKHYIAGQCHPDVFDALEGHDTTLYLTILPGTEDIVAHIDKPKHRIAGWVGTVGIKALCWAYALGYRELHLYGYDSSYAGDTHHAFEQKLNDNVNTIEVFLDGKKYVTTPPMAHQVSEFCQMAGEMTRSYGFDINLHCDGLLPAMVDYSNRRGEVPLASREAEKYRQMWTHDAYRKFAPGEHHVERAIEALSMDMGSVIDFGCGTGRGAQAFKDRGFSVIGIDFASNCLDPDSTFRFLEACLWSLPDISATYGFCTDVMEHIPSEKVEDVLKGIARSTQSAYFNIATTDDMMGSLIGHKLHLTVMNCDGWAKVMRKYWGKVEVIPSENDAVFVVSQPIRLLEKD